MFILEMKNISKAFAATQALSNVDFSVRKGEIHALLGENGAGKSTLMNILAGVHHADSGAVIFDGREYRNLSINQMEKAGIAFVHQELNIVNDLTVSENIFLNREISNGIGILKRKEMVEKTRKLFEDLGVEIDPTVMVSELKTSEKQLLEICRALYTDAKLLILDEPTTALNNDEIAHLFGILKKLREAGKSFIFISHKMPEIFEISDNYTVLCNGKLVSTGSIAETNPHDVTSDMVGKQFADKDSYSPRELGEVVLELKDYSGEGFSKINLQVRRGEIVALTGLAGSGAGDLMQAMFGAIHSTEGHIIVNGKKMRGSINKFMRNKIGMLPTNRKENSVVPDMTVLENTYIAEHSLSRRIPFINKKAEIKKYEDMKSTLSIRAEDPHNSITSLSGGNQQKVFLARWLNTDAEILLFDNPTQGVDVGAKAEIYELILEFARNGKTIIINTLEIPEIIKVSDRCAVLYAGEITKIFDHNEINEQDVMLYSTNAINVAGEN